MSEKLTDEKSNQWIHKNVIGGCWHELSKSGQCQKCYKYFSSENPNPDYCNLIGEAWKVLTELESRIDDDGRKYFWTFSKNQNEHAASYDMRIFLMNKRDTAPHKKSIAVCETPARAICKAAKGIIDE